MSIREQTEERERANLAEHATLASASRGREKDEPLDPIRTAFQRDRDRILHSKAFRRLMHKTQVFISPTGDHYRTRLTHTLEVSQIARTIARALRLNEDLTEAVALGHDVGHTPFGHAGESALDEAIQKHDSKTRFRHYEQSLRVFTVLENLNLTWETREGIEGHSKGRADLTAFDGEQSPSLEAAVVRVSDRIAYLNHDVDDALRADWLSLDKLPKDIANIGATHSARVSAMVQDLIANSVGKPTVSFTAQMLALANSMKEFLFENLYLEYPRRFPDIEKAQGIVRSLFNYYVEKPYELPDGFESFQGAVDFVSGMTDRYATRLYTQLFVPAEWALSD